MSFDKVPVDQLTAQQAYVELMRLRDEILHHDELYYLKDMPAIS